MKTAYTYTILRYVHDVASGESLNVGVVLFAPSVRYVSARIQTNYGRLKKAFPNLDGDAHRELMRYLQSSFDRLQTQVEQELPFEQQPGDAAAIACKVLPKDDSSLQWSPVGGGLCSSPSMELERLYKRVVVANDGQKADGGRSDDDVWATYREPLVRQNVIRFLAPHVVTAKNDDHLFEHAWQNHQWHCLEPFSLDLLDAEKIKSKAHRLLGAMTGVREVVSDHRLYLMVGEPQLDRCKPAAQRALNLLLGALPLPTEIIRESEAEAFSLNFAQRIKEHEKEEDATVRIHLTS